ncbi:hypothetical protein GN956_G17361 [Arapaima gigas]
MSHIQKYTSTRCGHFRSLLNTGKEGASFPSGVRQVSDRLKTFSRAVMWIVAQQRRSPSTWMSACIRKRRVTLSRRAAPFATWRRSCCCGI